METLTVADARDVARFLVQLSEKDQWRLTPLELQKHLYYCQGWSLALLGRPLFRQALEAWRHGPVVADLYAMLHQQRDNVTAEQIGRPSIEFSTTERELMTMVYREYRRYRVKQLIDMTHREPAWLEARVNLHPDEKCRKQLSLETLREYFTEQAKLRSLSNFDAVTEWREAEKWEEQGSPTVSFKDVRNQLLSEIA